MRVFVAEVEACIAQLMALPAMPAHWVNRLNNYSIHIDLHCKAIPAYIQLVQELAQKRSGVSVQLLQKANTDAAKLLRLDPAIKPFDIAVDAVASEIYRPKVLKYRAREMKGSDTWALWTLQYFQFPFYLENKPDEIDRLWEEIYPVHSLFYTAAALGNHSRGRLLDTTIRRLTQLVLPYGTQKQKQRLLDELVKINDKLKNMVSREELERTIQQLKRHMADATQPWYIHLTTFFYESAQKAQRTYGGEQHFVSLASREYDAYRSNEMNLVQFSINQGAGTGAPPGKKDDSVGPELDSIPSQKEMLAQP